MSDKANDIQRLTTSEQGRFVHKIFVIIPDSHGVERSRVVLDPGLDGSVKKVKQKRSNFKPGTLYYRVLHNNVQVGVQKICLFMFHL